MNGLTSELLSRACRIFLAHAYPEGEKTIPPTRRRFAAIAPGEPLDALLAARDVCEKLLTPEGTIRGYAFRLGSAWFPHVKLQATCRDNGAAWVFGVDTHDALRCTVSADEAEAWARLQTANRRLKEHVEGAWEKEGLLTFNALLRSGLRGREGGPGVGGPGRWSHPAR
jgi:hypothetical protein